MATEDDRLREFLVRSVAPDLNPQNRREIVFIRRLPSTFKEASGLDIMEKLMELGLVSPSNLTELVRILGVIKREDLAKRVEKHVKKESKVIKVSENSKPHAKHLLVSCTQSDVNLRGLFDILRENASCISRHLDKLKEDLVKEEDDRCQNAEPLVVRCEELVNELQRTLKEARSAAKVSDSTLGLNRVSQASLTQLTSPAVMQATAARDGETVHVPGILADPISQLSSAGGGLPGRKRPVPPPRPRATFELISTMDSSFDTSSPTKKNTHEVHYKMHQCSITSAACSFHAIDPLNAALEVKKKSRGVPPPKRTPQPGDDFTTQSSAIHDHCSILPSAGEDHWNRGGSDSPRNSLQPGLTTGAQRNAETLPLQSRSHHLSADESIGATAGSLMSNPRPRPVPPQKPRARSELISMTDTSEGDSLHKKKQPLEVKKKSRGVPPPKRTPQPGDDFTTQSSAIHHRHSVLPSAGEDQRNRGGSDSPRNSLQPGPTTGAQRKAQTLPLQSRSRHLSADESIGAMAGTLPGLPHDHPANDWQPSTARRGAPIQETSRSQVEVIDNSEYEEWENTGDSGYEAGQHLQIPEYTITETEPTGYENVRRVTMGKSVIHHKNH